MAAIALAGLAALTACLPPVGEVALRQPAAPPTVWDNSDPGVLVVGRRVYLFGSNNNVDLPVRLVTSFGATLQESREYWDENPRNALARRPAWVDPARTETWAPSPVRIGNTYHVYFAAHRAGARDRLNDQCIGRASAASPIGPYRPEALPLYCGLPPEPGSNPWGRGALDPEVFRGPDGRLYLLMALSRTRENIGVVPLASNGRVVGGTNAAPRILVRQEHPWQDGTDDATLGWTFLENPSMVFDPATRTYLLFYSAGSWSTAHYVTGFARCESPLGPCAVDGRGPFLVGGSGRSGVGGLTVFVDPDGILRVAYASWKRGSEHPSADGTTSRQTTWSRLVLSPGSDPARQSVRLQP